MSTHWPNATYQQTVLRDVTRFLGPTKAVVVTPAGTITAASDWPNYTVASLRTGVDIVQCIVGELEHAGEVEILLGVDLCIPGEATPFQSVIRCGRKLPGPIAVKLHPTSHEFDSLLGGFLCRERRTRHLLRS